MNTIRSTAFSAGIFFLTALGGPALTACSVQSIIGTGSGGGGGSGGSGGSGATTGTTSGSGGGGGATLIFNASGLDLNPWGLTVDANNVYFTDAAGPNGKVVRVPLDGSPASELAIGQELPSAITVDATDVYYTTIYAVKKVPIAGGAPITLSPAVDGGYAGIVVDSSNVYWTNYTSPGSTMFVPKAGGSATTVDSGDKNPSGLVVQGGSIYWAAMGDGVIKTAPVAGGAATVFASGQKNPRSGLAADATNLYWLTEGDFPNHLVKAPLAGGPPVLVAVPVGDASTPQSLIVDATHAYFIDPSTSGCGIAKVELATGTVTTIPLGGSLGCPTNIAADAANLYYTSSVGITKLPK